MMNVSLMILTKYLTRRYKNGVTVSRCKKITFISHFLAKVLKFNNCRVKNLLKNNGDDTNAHIAHVPLIIEPTSFAVENIEIF